jgi:hypothetical protein
MAGETTNFDEYSTTIFNTFGPNVGVLDRTNEVATGELELADVMQVGKVPSGATYLYGYIATDDLDSNGTPALEFILGDDDDDNGLLVTGSNAGQAAGITTFNGAYITNKTTTTAEKTISLKVGTAAATAAAGTVRVVLFYYTA